MKNTICPYCKEDIKIDALICKHCKTKLSYTKEEKIINAISGRIKIGTYSHSFDIPTNVTACEASCQKLSGASKEQCLDDCKATAYLAFIVERLHKELSLTVYDIIWGGGDIDPIPFEKEVRERFYKNYKKD